MSSRKPVVSQLAMRSLSIRCSVFRRTEPLPGKLRSLEISHDRHTVFVRPELVVEIAFNEVQASAQYPGGLALRFARVKSYRQDKPATETDTIETVREIYLRSIGQGI